MKTFQTVNPHNELTIEEYRFATTKEINQSLLQSQDAYSMWRKRPLSDRVKCVEKLATLLKENRETLAVQMTSEMGKPIQESRAEISKCALLCSYYSENADSFLSPKTVLTDAQHSYLRYDPIGTILGIMPWNFPLWQVFRCAIPAIFAGNTFILKHALNVMGTALSIEKLFLEADFPEHVFVNTIARHEDIEGIINHSQIGGVALTGSVEAGSAVAKLAGAAIKPCILELGGSDAFIVLEDCDIDRAVEAGIFSRMLNNGQSCIAAKRFLIQRSIHDTFLEKMIAKVSQIRLGDPMDEDTTMGPMARPDLRQHLRRQVDTTLHEGAVEAYKHHFQSESGYYFSPIILSDVDPNHTMFIEETFGPAIAITKIETLEEAVKISNQSAFGLGATIWTKNTLSDALISQMDVGTIAINGFVKSDPRLPFGGTKKSGFGRELSKSGIHAFVNEKVVSRFS